MNFNGADWAIVIVVVLSTVMSLKRGFIKEALSLVTWVAAFIVARMFHGNMVTLLTEQVESPVIRSIAAFAVLFVGTLIVGAAISFLIGTLVKMTGLSTTDRLLGMFFGFARGLILLTVAVALIRVTPFVESEWWKQSILIKQIELVEQWSRSALGDNVSGLLGKISESGI